MKNSANFTRVNFCALAIEIGIVHLFYRSAACKDHVYSNTSLLLCHNSLSKSGSTWLPEQTVQSASGQWVPDEFVRVRAKGLIPGEIQSVEFTGVTMVDIDGAESLNVSSPEIIQVFVNALQHAMYWYKLVNPDDLLSMQTGEPYVGVGEIRIYLKNHRYVKDTICKPHEGDRPLVFPFRPWIEQCYGPEFFSALQRLEKYQSDQVREEIKRIGNHVMAIQLSLNELALDDDFPPNVTKPAEVKQVLDALAAGDHRIYACTYDGPGSAAHPICQLRLQDGTKVNLCVILPPLRDGLTDDSAWLFHLWKYLNRPDPIIRGNAVPAVPIGQSRPRRPDTATSPRPRRCQVRLRWRPASPRRLPPPSK